MAKFKAMKFWIGRDPACSERAQKILFDMGYRWPLGRDSIQYTEAEHMRTTVAGKVLVVSEGDDAPGEEVNIDWLRTPKLETVELNGKTYLKADLEAALEKLEPVEG